MVLAERIRTSLAQLELKHAGSASGADTLSIGIAQAQYDGALNATALVERADTALYRAKQSGRDRVCYAELAPQVCDDTLADASLCDRYRPSCYSPTSSQIRTLSLESDHAT